MRIISRRSPCSNPRPTPPDSRSASMSTYSLSETDGRATNRPAPAASLGWLRARSAGVTAGLAWVAFGLSCLLWADVGDWSRTYALGIAAFVIAAAAFGATLAANHLGGAGRALRQRAPWLAALGLVLTLWELA